MVICLACRGKFDAADDVKVVSCPHCGTRIVVVDAEEALRAARKRLGG